MMSVKHTIRDKSDISAATWALSFFSGLLPVLLGFLIVTQLESARIDRQSAALKTALQSGSQTGAQLFQNLVRILKPQGLAVLISKPRPEIAELQTLEEAAKAFENEQYDAAESKLALLRQNSIDPDGVQEIRSAVKNSSLYAAGIRESREMKSAWETSYAEHERNFKALREDLSRFFGMSTRAQEGVAFYKKGILQGLPVIEPLPDEIPDVITFAQLLADAQGRIADVENQDNQQAYFLEKLQDFQDRSFQIFLREEELRRQYQEIDDSFARNTKDFQSERQIIERSLYKVAADFLAKGQKTR